MVVMLLRNLMHLYKIRTKFNDCTLPVFENHFTIVSASLQYSSLPNMIVRTYIL